MKKFNNWILNAISGSQTDKNETTEELKGAKFIILYAYSMLVLLALVISNIFIHILEPKLSITTQIIIVWSIGGIIFGLVCYTMEDKK
ncbi:hypothetical protein BKC08_10790 [Staphylococcus aureus]|uniref:hypothetical protein n=1 Tax=Staphylococcus aureus TaxID=1280 RepID=UPI0009344318|nr:hypothetical protein [Staphylococcus aureus]OJZ26460.1 hypothetical protein BKC08_10790 [Staphylococcus aureus]